MRFSDADLTFLRHAITRLTCENQDFELMSIDLPWICLKGWESSQSQGISEQANPIPAGNQTWLAGKSPN